MMMKTLTRQGLVLLVLLLAFLLSACGENASSTPDSTPDSVSSATPEGSASVDTGKMPDVDMSGSDDTETPTTAAPEGSASDDTEKTPDVDMSESDDAETPTAADLPNGTLEISFDFTRGTTPASNQFAIWIEDSNGNLVRILYVTNFTANGGYTKRAESIPTWVSKAKPAELPDAEIDSISGATPRAGTLSYTWDGTDENGNMAAKGTYTVYVEGTLYWTSSVLFHGDFEFGAEAQENIPMISDYTEDEATNRDMLTNVSARYIAYN